MDLGFLNNRRVQIGGLIAGGLVAMGIFLLAIFGGSGQDDIQLQSTDPANSAVVNDPQPTIKFKFSQAIARFSEQPLVVSTSPEFKFTKQLVDNELIITPDQRLTDNKVYNIVLLNIVGADGSLLKSASVSFTVDDTSARGQFIDSTPFYGDGFTISYLSDGSWYVQISKLPEQQYKDAALAQLQSNGVDPAKETINFELTRFLRGSGAPPN